MKRKIVYSFIFAASLLLLTACGSDSKPDREDGGVPGQELTSLSIVYESSEYDELKGMIGHYHVHAVDENAKPISGLALDVSLVNGVKEIRNQKMQNATGNIQSSEPISFYDDGVNFLQTDVAVGDTLIIVPSAGKTGVYYLGDWKIGGIDTALTLRENSFSLETTEGLTYIVGNDERLLGGDGGSRGTLAVAHIEFPDNTTDELTTDGAGFIYFDVVFDPILAGHTITLGAHTYGNRIGTAMVASLRGAEFAGSTVTVPNSGSIEYAAMTLSIDPGNGGTEHLIDVDIVPSSFVVEPLESCSLNNEKSDFHTDGGGRVLLAINTQGKVETIEDDNSTTISGADECTVTWNGDATSIYLEY